MYIINRCKIDQFLLKYSKTPAHDIAEHVFLFNMNTFGDASMMYNGLNVKCGFRIMHATEFVIL